MTDPIQSNPHQDPDSEKLHEEVIEGLEELTLDAEISDSPPVAPAPQLEEPLPDLSALFEDEPLTPAVPSDQEQTLGFYDDSPNEGISAQATSLGEGSSGSFKVLDESGLNEAAGNADISDQIDASSDQDISDMLEGYESHGTTSARAANLSPSSSGSDSSGDIDFNTVSENVDSSNIDDVQLDIIPTSPGITPASTTPPKAGKSKSPPKPSIPSGTKRSGGMLVGLLLGLLSGGAASQALWLYGIELPSDVRQADSTQIKALKDLSELANTKAKGLESDLETLKTASEEASSKAKAGQDLLVSEKQVLVAKLTEQTNKSIQDIKIEQAKGEKALKEAMLAAAKELDDQKAAAKADLQKYEKDLDITKTEAKSALDKALAEGRKEKSRADEQATMVALHTKGLATIAEKLKTAGFGDSKTDPVALAPLVDKALAVAQMKDPAGEIRTLTTKMADEKARLEGEIAKRDTMVKKHLEDLGRRRHPAENMLMWRALLASGSVDSVHATEAAKDAMHVLAIAPTNSPEAVQAKIIATMADAARGKVTEAKAAVAGLTTSAASAGPGWAEVVKNLNDRLVSPAGLELAKARELAEFGKIDQAVAILKKAAASPLAGDPALPRLRAELALFLITADQKDLLQANVLADEASKANEALGYYVLGRLKESKGLTDEAGILFSQALKAAKETDPMLSQYRLARIRRLRGMAGNPAATAMMINDTQSLTTWLLIAMTLVDAEKLDVIDPLDSNIKKQIRAILADPKASPEEKAYALLMDDQPLQALEMLHANMSKTLGNRQPETLDLMSRILKKLEGKQATTQSLTLSPAARKTEAYRLYGKGKQQVLAGQFEIAEETLTAAIKYAGSDVDARFNYFLGLAQLGQGDPRTAERSFLRALEMERRSQPSAREVSRALEEVQGPARDRIDALRYGAVIQGR